MPVAPSDTHPAGTSPADLHPTTAPPIHGSCGCCRRPKAHRAPGMHPVPAGLPCRAGQCQGSQTSLSCEGPGLSEGGAAHRGPRAGLATRTTPPPCTRGVGRARVLPGSTKSSSSVPNYYHSGKLSVTIQGMAMASCSASTSLQSLTAL